VREGGELQGGCCGNEQWYAGAQNSFAARERARIPASGERRREVPCRAKGGEGELAVA